MTPEQAHVWNFRRRLYYWALGGFFCAIAFYFGPHLILFRKLTPLSPSDFVDEVQERCVPVVRAIKEFERDNGRLPEKIDEVVPRYLPEVDRGQMLVPGEYFVFMYRGHAHKVGYRFDGSDEHWEVSGPFARGRIPLPAVELSVSTATASRPAAHPLP
jgi:hypothetical protein